MDKMQPTAILLGALLATLLLDPLSAQIQPRSQAGQTLKTPEEELDRGLVYYTEPGGDSQIVLTSRASLQKVVFTNARVIGYILTPFDLEEAPLPVLSGAFRIPVRMFKSGVDGSHRILRSNQLLDSENHPDISFRIEKISEVALVEASSELRSYRLTLEGPLGVKGKSYPLKLAGKIRFMPTTMRTFARNVGDLAVLETSCRLKLSDYGWKPERNLEDRIGDEIQIEVYLMLNTVSPDKSPDPRDDPALFQQQMRFLTLLRDLEDPASAYAMARSLLPQIWDDTKELQRLVRAIVETRDIVRRDYRVALKVATRASTLAHDRDPAILALIAGIHHATGAHSEAVDWQQKAVDQLADNPRPHLDDKIRSVLKTYRKELRAQAGEHQ